MFFIILKSEPYSHVEYNIYAYGNNIDCLFSRNIFFSQFRFVMQILSDNVKNVQNI